MVCPFLKGVQVRDCIHKEGAAPSRVTGSPLHSAECQDKLRMLWTRQRLFGTNKCKGLSNEKDLSRSPFAGKNIKIIHIDVF